MVIVSEQNEQRNSNTSTWIKTEVRKGSKEGVTPATAVHVRRVRGGQRGLERDGANLAHQSSERRVKPFFLPSVSITLNVSSWEAHPVTDPQAWGAQMGDWSGKTAPGMLNSVGKPSGIAPETEAARREE